MVARYDDNTHILRILRIERGGRVQHVSVGLAQSNIFTKVDYGSPTVPCMW